MTKSKMQNKIVTCHIIYAKFGQKCFVGLIGLTGVN